ncbi:MAG: FeoA domain-containing protein [Candidatus Omnitrophota bacterium]
MVRERKKEVLYGGFHIIRGEAKGQLSSLLKANGINDENAADIFMENFSARSRHVSAEEMRKLLIEKNISIDEKLVTEIFEKLVESGFALQIQVEGEKFKRYEPLFSKEHHDHFICVKCKKIREFGDEELESMQDSLIFRHGWKPLYHKLEVYGVCGECLGKEKKVIPVTFAKEDQTVKVVRIERGWKLKKKLTELGLLPGESVRIIKNSNGPVILEIKQARFAIGRGEAHKILVREEG